MNTTKPHPENETPTFPIRINRYLRLTGQTSRREADRLIEAGEVFVNGETAVLGQMINENDSVTLSKKAEAKQSNHVYVALNKPVGFVSHNPVNDQREASSLLPKNIGKRSLAPLGRLDRASQGLMIFTTDGRIIHNWLSPEFEHEKEYIVTVNRELKDRELARLERPLKLEGFTTKGSKVTREAGNRFRIILTEGKKHQIRRMCDKLGVAALKLERVRIGPVKLGNLASGAWRPLTQEEVATLLEHGIENKNFA